MTALALPAMPDFEARSLAVDALIERARGYAENAQAPNTRRAYDSGLRDFHAFCDAHGLAAFPATPQTVVEYVTHLAARAKVSLDAIARTTRHKSLSVLLGCVRPAQAFDDVALTAILS